MRPKPLLDLLNSVKKQSLYPDEILIIDGSTNDETKLMLSQNIFQNLIYHKVPDNERGLTKQRNYGINRTSPDSEVICFLDDDTILEQNYFEEIIKTYSLHPEAFGCWRLYQ
jgi:glycosyltransferase involved in cell wall biosynthesis